ncbi:urease accessory protein UreJ [Acidovorax sp. Root275]|uniref:HupE/UreJ family protein n=1 Tax=unclassified Acidovorax TaxID=2684926 RepID=UPI00070BBA66|nr:MULTISPECIES: HupE/UreJ family protein [unclassified Acidovorax]KRD15736.1 urease accessory protein UreJ [Acidovorax sp. Root267]KRD41975.1 urease accessory protein UreJ [Acidovorax sp. Root275]
MRIALSHRHTAALFFIAFSAISTGASAHTGAEPHMHSSFLSGFAHPLFGMDHLAAMVAVGLWSALAARSAGRDLLWGPVGFAAMLLAGAVLGLQGVALPAVESMIAASLLATGLLVVSRLRVPGIVAALGVGVFAVFHGVAHGVELAGSNSVWQTLAGMLAATVLLHGAGLAAGLVLRHRQVWLARAAGAGVAAFGGVLLAQMA